MTSNGFVIQIEGSGQLKDLADIMNRFYQEAIDNSREGSEKSFAETTYKHSSRVAANVLTIYQAMSQSLDEHVYAAAICHDMGRVAKMPESFKGTFEQWDNARNEYHPQISGDICVEYLKKAGYDDKSAGWIKDIILSHGLEDIGDDAPMATRVIQTADKIDRMGKDGVARIYSNRVLFCPQWSDEKKVRDVKQALEKAYITCQKIGLAQELVQSKYEEGLAEVARLEKTWNRRSYWSMSTGWIKSIFQR